MTPENMKNSIENKMIPNDVLDQVSGGSDPDVIIEPDPFGSSNEPMDPLGSVKIQHELPHSTIKGPRGPRRQC